MTFTQIPQQYAPLGGEIRYALTAEEAATFDLRIVDAGSGKVLGAKRFAGATAVSFDAAPILRRAVRFIPARGGTGFHATDGRTVLAFAEAATSSAVPAAAAQDAGEPAAGDAADAPLASALRTFLPRMTPVAAPALLTTMPPTRLIAPGECDELTFFADEACTVTVTAQVGTIATAESYRTLTGGVHVFRLDTRDFPGAETLTVDAGACGTVAYTVVAAVPGSRRLAWRSSAGSIEHYTFPVEQSVTLETVKKRAYGSGGHLVARAATERRSVLVSAYETRAAVEALAEITASPDVWLAGGEEYEAVDIVTGKAVVHRHGAVSCLEIEIRPKHKTGMLWN